jgi:hypothetical protein
VNFNVNFNILKQFNCALVGRIKDLIYLIHLIQSQKKCAKEFSPDLRHTGCEHAFDFTRTSCIVF